MNLFDLMKHDYNDFLISAEDFVNSAKEYQKNYKNETIHLTFEEYQNLIKDIENDIHKKCKIKIKNADLTTVYLNGVYDGEKKAKDKIKAKIEELEKIIEFEKPTYEDVLKYAIEVLQSLLEKE